MLERSGFLTIIGPCAVGREVKARRGFLNDDPPFHGPIFDRQGLKSSRIYSRSVHLLLTVTPQPLGLTSWGSEILALDFLLFLAHETLGFVPHTSCADRLIFCSCLIIR